MARGFTYADGASREVDEASRPMMHRATLVMHAQSRNALVREIIARRADLPIGLTVTLAHDSSEDVRAAIAGNPVATRAVLEHLSTDRSLAVLVALVNNVSLGLDLLEKLLLHKRPEVRSAAADRLDSRAGHLAAVHEDVAMPEIRDISARLSATNSPTSETVAPESGAPAQEVRRPTRTAPIRGFRIPPEPTP